jgi:signal peptidase I
MHQRRRIKRLPGLLACQLRGGQAPQFVVDQRRQPRGRRRVALLKLIQDLRDFVHGGEIDRIAGNASITDTLGTVPIVGVKDCDSVAVGAVHAPRRPQIGRRAGFDRLMANEVLYNLTRVVYPHLPPARPAAMPSLSKAKKFALGCAAAFLVAAVIVRVFFMDTYRIPQNGMYPGLPAGSLLIAARRAYSAAPGVKRGDIVIFVREENGQRYNYIWRVVALPGEKVDAAGESLRINGQAVQRQRVRETDGRTIFREQIGDVAYEVAFDSSPRDRPPDVSIIVPADQFFVMGDNRFSARDSRYFGPIPFSSIIGKKL